MSTAVVLHAAAFVAALAGYRPLLNFDHALDRALYHKAGPGWVRVCFFVLQLGATHWLAAVGAAVALALLLKRRWLDVAGWAFALAGCAGLDAALKHAFRRPRPPTLDWMPGYTFPSGHTMGATVAYGMLAYFLCRPEPRPARRRLYVVAAAVLVALVAVALIVPGFHYFTDVLSGYAVGITWLAACVALLHVARRPTGLCPLPRR